MDPQIHTFLLELLHDAGQTDLGHDIEELMVQDLAVRLEDRLMLTLMQHLSTEQEEELKKITGEGKSTEELMNYCKEKIPDFEKIIAEAMLDFREVYIQASKGE